MVGTLAPSTRMECGLTPMQIQWNTKPLGQCHWETPWLPPEPLFCMELFFNQTWLGAISIHIATTSWGISVRPITVDFKKSTLLNENKNIIYMCSIMQLKCLKTYLSISFFITNFLFSPYMELSLPLSTYFRSVLK